jgi:hypothetical protein
LVVVVVFLVVAVVIVVVSLVTFVVTRHRAFHTGQNIGIVRSCPDAAFEGLLTYCVSYSR